jgi:hypothetical protein
MGESGFGAVRKSNSRGLEDARGSIVGKTNGCSSVKLTRIVSPGATGDGVDAAPHVPI